MLDKIEEKAADWLARVDRGVEPEDLEAFESWLARSTAHRVAYLRLKEAWNRAGRLSALRNPRSAGNNAEPGKFGILFFRSLAAVAALALVCGVGASFYIRSTQNIYTTSIGRQKIVKLSDGSRMELNTNTRVQTKVAGNVRTVTLDKGEVYFEVVHDPRHPFVVFAGNRKITDLGTKFSVLHDGDAVEIVVKEGKVRVDTLDQTLQISPTFVTGGNIVEAKADETLVAAKTQEEIASELGWRNGMLMFNQETLADVAAEFNRYNKKQIVVEGAARDVRVGGSFRSDNVDTFAVLVQEGFGLSVQDNGNEIVISK